MSKKAAASDKDHFDDLIRHVLSFLPGDDALQTCVLDTRWRDLWRHTSSLRFMQDEWSSPSGDRFKQLVKLIIQLRGNSLLTDCQINLWPSGFTLEHTKLLIKYVLDCQVQELIVCSDCFGKHLLLKERPISQHLKIIEFTLVDFEVSSVNFSRCPVLEELTMDWCKIHAFRIFSRSLKHLRFFGFCSFPQDFRIHIDAPYLTSLQLECFEGLTPLLGEMPLLETAAVCIGDSYSDSCESNRQDFNDPPCTCCDDECLLLNGLSNASDLELIAKSEGFIYRWDLAWCPIFAKLKTLILDEWFTAIDLVCILQHSPVLEILTLKLHNTKNLIGTTEGQEIIEQPFLCAHLKVVNIEVEEVDEGVHKILKILRTCGILRDHISIKPLSFPSDSSSSDSDASSTDSD